MDEEYNAAYKEGRTDIHGLEKLLGSGAKELPLRIWGILKKLNETLPMVNVNSVN